MRDSGPWVLLGSSFFTADTVREAPDGDIVVRIAPDSAESDERLRQLRPDEFGHSELIPYAYQNDGALARVVSAQWASEQGRTVWTIVVRPDRSMQNRSSSEMAYGNLHLSADDIAVLRARLLLLDERPPMQDTGMLLDVLVAGVNAPVQVREGIFVKLWAEFKGQRDHFLPLARLTAVFFLKASNTCEQIVDLALGPITGERLPVIFHGRRHQYYSNQPASEIRLSGTCLLSPSAS